MGMGIPYSLNLKPIVMKIINTEDLHKKKPLLVLEMDNQKGQRVRFYEDPTCPSGLIIGYINGVAFLTDFTDTDDFFDESDHNPILTEDKQVLSYFESVL